MYAEQVPLSALTLLTRTPYGITDITSSLLSDNTPLVVSQRCFDAFVLGQCLSNMSRDRRFPTMWYVRPAKPKASLRTCAV